MDFLNKIPALFDSAAYWILHNASDTFLVVVFLAVMLGVLAATTLVGQRSTAARRLSGDSTPIRGDVPQLRSESRDGFWVELVSAVEKRVPLIDEKNRSTMHRRLMQAGFFSPGAVRNYYAIRFFLTICLPIGFLLILPLLGTGWSNQSIIVVAVILCLGGLYLPSIWLARRISHRQRAIAEGFPDALDMMVVCVEAGLGLDAAFNRVGAELTRAHPALATQLALVSLELRAGKSRADALRNFAERIGIDEISSFVTLMIQSDALGTSVAQTLTVHADEMRVKRTMRAEELAHKLPVKLTVPLILFILPCMMTVILLPGIISIIRTLLPALAGNN
jgi:tight adherence protein C